MKTKAPAPYRPVPRVDTVTAFGHRLDAVGDLHGCVDEAVRLMETLGHTARFPDDPNLPAEVTIAPGRALVFLGDITDRGPRSRDALRLVEGAIATGAGFSVLGNHDSKLLRALAGQPVQIANGLQGTLDDLATVDEATRKRWLDMLHGLPHQIKAPAPAPHSADGWVTFAHGAAPAHHQDKANANSLSRALYGYADGAVDSNGNLIRDDWAAVYQGPRMVVHGHTPTERVVGRNRVVCVDTGAVFGGRLSALRIDTGQVFQVDSATCAKERPGVTRASLEGAGTVHTHALEHTTVAGPVQTTNEQAKATRTQGQER
jgi:protein phosphatase